MYSDYIWHRHQRKRFRVILFSIITILSCVTNFLHAGERIATSRVQPSIIRPLRYIDANKAKQYLSKLGIGKKVSKLGGVNALSITTNNDREMAKASAVISLIDSKMQYELIRLTVNSIPERIDDASHIQAKIEGIVLGTFRNPPSGTKVPKAIIDVEGSNFIVLVPKGYAPPIIAILEDIYNNKAYTAKSSEAVRPDIDIERIDALLSARKNAHISEKTVEKVASEPAVVPSQIVLTETPVKRVIEEVEPKTNPASVMADKNVSKSNEPTMSDLMAKIEELTNNNLGANVSVQPVAEIRMPVERREPVKPAPVKKISSERKSSSGFDKNLSEAELETVISLPTKVLVVDLLKLVGEQLGLNYMYDPKEVAGEVTLFINDGKVKVGQLYGLLENVLQFRGLAMTRRGKFVTIVKSGNISSIDPQIVLPGEELETGNVVVTQTFKLEYIDTKTAMVMLNSMKLGLSVQDIPQMQSLIITGYASRMERIAEVLKMVDKPGKERIFQFRTLKYTTASTLVSKIQTLAKELGSVSITIGSKTATVVAPTSTTRVTSAAARAAAIRAAAAKKTAAITSSKTTIGGAAGDGSVYLDIDDRTNRILMIGVPESIDLVGSLIDSLDIAQSGLKEMRQYKIINVEAAYVIDVLGELGATTPGARPPLTSSKTAPRPAPPVTNRGASSSVGPQVSLLEESNSLLINASSEEHDRITAIIKYIDVPKQDLRIVKEYVIESVDTSEILNTMVELGMISTMPGSSSSTRRTSTTPTASRTSKTTPSVYGSTTSSPQGSTSSDPVSGEPMIAILEAANSLLVNATDEQHMQIEMLIAHVDRDPADTAMPYVIYSLTSQTALDLKPILDEVISAKLATNPTSSSAKKPAVPATAKIMSTPNTGPAINDKERIEIVADENTNSLIVYASKKNQTWIGNLIEELDEYRPQVLLDVTLVEISRDDEFNFDLDLVSKYGGFNRGESMESSHISPLLTPFPANKILEAGILDGIGSAFYSDNHIQALFTIMDKKGYGRILARPSLLVKDNEPGQIKTERKRYVAQEKSSTTFSSTSSVPTTSSDVTFVEYLSGITLDITPHISSEKLLQLEILLDRKDFIDDGVKTISIGTGENIREVPRPYDETSSTVSTWAILPDGATIILGGIETISQNKSVKKIPILGDIPIIGALFRGIDEVNKQSKLYVFVKAHIINPGDELTGTSDIELISMKKRNLFEEEEKKFQGLRAIPGIKPNPIQPVRILEDDEYLTEIRAGRQVGGNTISIPVVRPAAARRGSVVDNDEYLRKIRDAKIKEIEEAAVRDRASDAAGSGILLDNDGYIKEPRVRQLMGSTTRVEIVLP